MNQSMTIGFSADLEYSVVRCETFVSYLTGEDSLFNDRFSGTGVCIYEEVPSSRRAAGITGKSMEAFTMTEGALFDWVAERNSAMQLVERNAGEDFAERARAHVLSAYTTRAMQAATLDIYRELG